SKLLNSLKRSGSDDELARRVLNDVEQTLKDGMSTQEIYKHAFNLLRQFEYEYPVAAARYSIKRAILELGPSGFPFEQFIAGVMTAHGAEGVTTGVMLQGKCVPHEVDVVGRIHGKRFGMEVKFHNSLSTKTDLKVALYIKARFDDLALAGGENYIGQAWLVTNTRFTRNVVRYIKCSGSMKLLGWDYPRKRGLEVLIEEAHLHPITMLTTITNREKLNLLEADKVLCRDILDNKDVLIDAGVHQDKIDVVLHQVKELCNS
ncbi:MAG: ATPase, partial [Candidatus Pacebacteria bacterium]|nr:ATPase [Candidatus Paceibacterota bacterium]